MAAGLGSGWSIARSDSWSVTAASPTLTRPAPVRKAVDALVFSALASRVRAKRHPLQSREHYWPVRNPRRWPRRIDRRSGRYPPVARFEPPPIHEIRERVLAPAPMPIHPEPPPIRHEPPVPPFRLARGDAAGRPTVGATAAAESRSPSRPSYAAPVRRGPQQHSVFARIDNSPSLTAALSVAAMRFVMATVVEISRRCRPAARFPGAGCAGSRPVVPVDDE